jgi:hypothetical protein
VYRFDDGHRPEGPSADKNIPVGFPLLGDLSGEEIRQRFERGEWNVIFGKSRRLQSGYGNVVRQFFGQGPVSVSGTVASGKQIDMVARTTPPRAQRQNRLPTAIGNGAVAPPRL